MQYTLITKQGKVYTFYVQALAEQFQQAYGGVVFTQQVLVDQLSNECYNMYTQIQKEQGK